MFFVLASLFVAFLKSVRDILCKTTVGREDEYIVTWSMHFFALPLLAVLVFLSGIPSVGFAFWPALFLCVFIDLAAYLITMRALKTYDVSLLMPFTSFTPLFLLLTSHIILGEFPGYFGLVGVLFIVVGSYFMNISQNSKGLLAPLKAVLNDKGPRMMLVVAFLISVTPNFDKIGVLNSSPAFWTFSLYLSTALVLTPFVIILSKKSVSHMRQNAVKLAPLGLVHGLMTFIQMTVLSIALVVYVVSIKRTSNIMTVILGHHMLKENCLRERLIGSILMVLGVILIALS
ncbi:MAG: EamA family transporter [Candidatus Aenigmarchaeota archaeon]|nr:EamA family transporter [Candidatus Aenigmarchaeota archaeon]